MVLTLFLGATFGTIAGLIHIILLLTLIDMIFGIAVTIKEKGKDQIVSNKLRNSLYKAFFYIMFVMMAFLIEHQLSDSINFSPKVIFGVIAAVEM